MIKESIGKTDLDLQASDFNVFVGADQRRLRPRLEALHLLAGLAVALDQAQVEQRVGVAIDPRCSARTVQAIEQHGRGAEVQPLGLPHRGIDQRAFERLPSAADFIPALSKRPQQCEQRLARIGDA